MSLLNQHSPRLLSLYFLESWSKGMVKSVMPSRILWIWDSRKTSANEHFRLPLITGNVRLTTLLTGFRLYSSRNSLWVVVEVEAVELVSQCQEAKPSQVEEAKVVSQCQADSLSAVSHKADNNQPNPHNLL